MACIAVVPIPQGSYSKKFAVSEISDNYEGEMKFRGNVKPNFPLQIGVTPSGEMQPLTPFPSPMFWPQLIDIASDCHDQNVKLCRCPISPDTLVLQTIRDIPVGQPLQLWFSEDLMITILGIPPYLSPFNIKGENSYVCHECHEAFERPNQLKLHLALHCDRLSPNVLWTRLKKSTSHSSPLLLAPPYIVNLSPAPALQSPYPLLTLSPPISSSKPSSSTLFRPHSLSPPSYHHHRNLLQVPTPTHFNNNNKSQFPNDQASSTSTASSSTPSPIIGVEAPVDVSSSDRETTPATSRGEAGANGRNSLVIQEQHHHHARLEAIVSNMGKAKNGHVCLYCGKLYSRKYGLKIHIRTHTGYKPLRCKICHRPFGDPSNLNKHVRLHADGSTPYRKVLVRRRDLDRHMRTRHHSHGSHTHNNGSTNGNGSVVPEDINLEHQRSQQSSLISSRSSATVTSTIVSSSRM